MPDCLPPEESSAYVEMNARQPTEDEIQAYGVQLKADWAAVIPHSRLGNRLRRLLSWLFRRFNA